MHTRDEQGHLWRGTWLSQNELERRQGELGRCLAEDRSHALDVEVLLRAAERLALRIQQGTRPELSQALKDMGAAPVEVEATLRAVGAFLRREHLEARLARELGRLRPAEVVRFDMRRPLFEAWAPLGVLVHVAPEEAPATAALSVVEGLLSGNINLLATSARSDDFALALLSALVEEDLSGRLAPFVYAFHLPAARGELLATLLAEADGVVTWGNETNVRELRELAPAAARLVVHASRLGIAYVAPSCFGDVATLEGLAGDACRLERPGASPLRYILLDTEEPSALDAFTRRFTDVLARVSADASWRVRSEEEPGFPSALPARSLAVRLMPRQYLVERLRPIRGLLRTASLACAFEELGALSNALLHAGVSRIVEPGHALDTYAGEPEDGAYILQRFSRRVSVQPGPRVSSLGSLMDLMAPSPLVLAPGVPVLTKAEFQERIDPQVAQVYFKSGGSTSEPVLSAFTYEDYEEQMRAMAEGLLAAGLDPREDRCANLFLAGNFYGGFVSFFTILEHMGVVQLPIVGLPDYRLAAQLVLRHRATALVGMASYIVQLMKSQAELFRADRVVKKIFYSGEHMSTAQAEELRREFGVEVIRSACYGSNDVGPMGFACPHCEGGVHHLLTKAQHLEILRLEKDEPVEGTEAGRLIFTSKLRRAQRVERYEIGDLGRWVPGPCPCGRKQPRFELLGRFGDSFRVVGHFISYRALTRILEEHLKYSGLFQVCLRYGRDREYIHLRLEEGSGLAARDVVDCLLREELHLKSAVLTMRVADLGAELVPPSAFAMSAQSGKLRPVVDEREAANRAVR
ncbi:acyl-CoA reductase [Archangium sp.]|uniref:acyl-CoA reductase n=1 Tax=Archangium sp. TaxID=1872627 RepID=UPI00286C7861|nr:acyl-CoA reductase [Archangium sp.]